jgi:hypothetical protein
MVVDYQSEYHYDGENSRVTVRLMGEPLEDNVLDNARVQMAAYDLYDTDLVVKQADSNQGVDIGVLQSSYADIIDEKNDQIRALKLRLESISAVDTLSGSSLSREVAFVDDNIHSISLSKHIDYEDGSSVDTLVVAIVRPTNDSVKVNTSKVKKWLQERTLQENVVVYIK